MHSAAYSAMQDLLQYAPLDTKLVLDCGSLNVNGTYRPLISDFNWNYFGIDIAFGRNVDIVVDPYTYPFENDTFDVVVSGSMLEHVEFPWVWMKEAARVLKVGGLLAIVTHWSFKLHRHPVDTFRYMPDGLNALFKWEPRLKPISIRIINEQDIVGSAIKC